VILVNVSQLAAIRTVHALQRKACATSSLKWQRTEGCCATRVNGPLNHSDVLVNWSTGRIARHKRTAMCCLIAGLNARPASLHPCMRHMPKHYHFICTQVVHTCAHHGTCCAILGVTPACHTQRQLHTRMKICPRLSCCDGTCSPHNGRTRTGIETLR
jgi:hypothetical protein